MRIEEFGGGLTGGGVFLFKRVILEGQLIKDLHDLVMAALSATVGYLAVMGIRKLTYYLNKK